MTTETETENTVEQVRLAFRLGWTTAELLGRLRKGVRPATHSPRRGDDYAPRLSVSDGRLANKGKEFLQTARRLLDLADALSLSKDLPPNAVQPVRALPGQIERWLKGARLRTMTPAALRQILDTWSLDAWSRLHARDDALARAFTAGMSLADTYWYLRRPGRGGLPDRPLAQEDWRRLLSVYRLNVERGRMQDLVAEMPSGVSQVLRHHLRSWSIGTELYYRDGRLRREAWIFRHSHPLGLLSRWRRVKRSPELEPAEERAIQDDLGRQAEIWQALIFGLRTPESYLYPADQSRVLWGARLISFLFLLLPLGLAAGLAVYGLALLLGGVVVPALLQAVQTTFVRATVGGMSDLLKLITSLLTAVGTLLVGIVPLLRWLRTANQRIRHELATLIVARRTRIPWNRTLTKHYRKTPPTQKLPSLGGGAGEGET